MMSNLGQQIIAGLQGAVDAMQTGKPLDELFPTSSWYAVDTECHGCGGDNVMRRDRTEPDGLFETTFVCRDCNTAFWLEG
jgi:hypothetical protein